MSYDPRSTSFLFLTIHRRYQTLVSFRDLEGCSKQSSFLRRLATPSVHFRRHPGMLAVIFHRASPLNRYLDTLVHFFACSTSILLLSPYLPELNLSLLPSTVQPESDSSIDDRWSKVVFQPKHDASPGPGSQSVTECKIILRPPQHDRSRLPPQLPLV